MEVIDLKLLIMKEGKTLTSIAKQYSEKYNEDLKLGNLSQKFIKGSLRLDEAIKIAKLLGYELEFKKIK